MRPRFDHPSQRSALHGEWRLKRGNMPDDPNSPAPKTQSWSRYQQVKRILNDASGSANPSYQGYNRFWELPLADLLELSLYGVRMIAPPSAPPSSCRVAPPAPAPASPCCHSAVPEPAAPPP